VLRKVIAKAPSVAAGILAPLSAADRVRFAKLLAKLVGADDATRGKARSST
jgi:hypothetical protein